MWNPFTLNEEIFGYVLRPKIKILWVMVTPVLKVYCLPTVIFRCKAPLVCESAKIVVRSYGYHYQHSYEHNG
jgi:hypothetical protein